MEQRQSVDNLFLGRVCAEMGGVCQNIAFLEGGRSRRDGEEGKRLTTEKFIWPIQWVMALIRWVIWIG